MQPQSTTLCACGCGGFTLQSGKRKPNRFIQGHSHYHPYRTVVDRLMERVDFDGPIPVACPERGNCHLWTGALKKSGYGYISTYGTGRQILTVHRVAYAAAEGLTDFTLQAIRALLGDMDVLHHCDVRNCVRRSHLFLGTQLDNNADMFRKGRNVHVLTGDQVGVIRALYNGGNISMTALGQQFGVSQTTISMAVRGVTWGHV